MQCAFCPSPAEVECSCSRPTPMRLCSSCITAHLVSQGEKSHSCGTLFRTSLLLMPATIQDKVEKLRQAVRKLKEVEVLAVAEEVHIQDLLKRLDSEEPVQVQSLLSAQLDDAIRAIQDELRSLLLNATEEPSPLEAAARRDFLRVEEKCKQKGQEIASLQTQLKIRKAEITSLLIQLNTKQAEIASLQTQQAEIAKLAENLAKERGNCKEVSTKLSAAESQIKQLEQEKQRLIKSEKDSKEANLQASMRVKELEEDRKKPKCCRCYLPRATTGEESWKVSAKISRPDLANLIDDLCTETCYQSLLRDPQIGASRSLFGRLFG